MREREREREREERPFGIYGFEEETVAQIEEKMGEGGRGGEQRKNTAHVEGEEKRGKVEEKKPTPNERERERKRERERGREVKSERNKERDKELSSLLRSL